MTYDEFKRQVGKAGITTREFAKLVKLNPNSITNYAKKGIVPSHLAIIVTLMGEMAENKINFKETLENIGLDSKKPRSKETKSGFKQKNANSIVTSSQ
ncbi:MAG: XRE family transcriptional regulator [Methylococcales bacterium]|nr:XRE family transcriptional regulator [Methylococcales bacterium]